MHILCKQIKIIIINYLKIQYYKYNLLISLYINKDLMKNDKIFY